MGEQRTSGTATVMFTDVESSTDITTRLGDDAAASLLGDPQHDRPRPGGRVRRPRRALDRATGSSSSSTRRAPPCRAPWRSSASSPRASTRSACGSASMPARSSQGDGELFGAAINLAARVMDRADGGEILTTDTVRQLVGTMTEASFRDRGPRRAQGLRRAPAPVRGPAGRGPACGAARRPAVRRAARGARGRSPARPSSRRRPRQRWRSSRGSGSADAVAVPPNSVAVIDPGKGPSSRPSRWTRTRGRSRPARAASGCSTRTARRSRTSTSRRAGSSRPRGIGGSGNRRRRAGQRRGVDARTSGSTPPGATASRRGAILHVVADEGGRDPWSDDVPVAGPSPRARPRRAEAAVSPPRGARSGRRRTARTVWCESTTTPSPGARR